MTAYANAYQLEGAPRLGLWLTPRPHLRTIGINELRPLPVNKGVTGQWDMRQNLWNFHPGSRLRATRWRPANADELRGLAGFNIGKFLKKTVKAVGKIAAKPIGLISKKLESNLVKISDKITDNVYEAGNKIGNFVKKNWKWIVVAAAVAVTIYTMGGAAGIAAKLSSAMTSIKSGAITAGKWVASKWTACASGIKKLLDGKKMGELKQEEVEAVGDVNEASGKDLIPGDILKCLGKQALTLAEQKGQAQEEAASSVEASLPDFKPALSLQDRAMPQQKSLPSWAIPAAAAAGGLLLILALK